ncbi:hypothetical protein RYX36_019895 [Vicia faba]
MDVASRRSDSMVRCGDLVDVTTMMKEGSLESNVVGVCGRFVDRYDDGGFVRGGWIWLFDLVYKFVRSGKNMFRLF